MFEKLWVLLGLLMLVFDPVLGRDFCDCCRCGPKGWLSAPKLPPFGGEPYPPVEVFKEGNTGLCRTLSGRSGLEELGEGRPPGIVV